MDADTHKNYLTDLGRLLREYALEAKARRDQSLGTDDQQFLDGYLSGFHRVISLMQLQAEGFGIPLSDLNLQDLDANEDLI